MTRLFVHLDVMCTRGPVLQVTYIFNIGLLAYTHSLFAHTIYFLRSLSYTHTAVVSLQALGRVVGGERRLRSPLHLDPVPEGGGNGLPGNSVPSSGVHAQQVSTREQVQRVKHEPGSCYTRRRRRPRHPS